MNTNQPRPRPPSPLSRRLLAQLLGASLAVTAIGAHLTHNLTEASHETSHTQVAHLADHTELPTPDLVTSVVPHHIKAMTIDFLHIPHTTPVIRRDHHRDTPPETATNL